MTKSEMHSGYLAIHPDQKAEHATINQPGLYKLLYPPSPLVSSIPICLVVCFIQTSFLVDISRRQHPPTLYP